MAFSKSVQFRGIKNAVKAYRNKDVPAWGLFQGTQFLEKYEGTDIEEGADFLNAFLDSLDLRSADGNTYTLCIYELPKGGKITNASKYDASFNFRLVDNFAEHQESRIGGMYDQRLSGIEETLKKLTTDDLPEPELSPKDKLFGMIGAILEHPEVQRALAMKVVTIMDGLGDTITGIFKKAGPYAPVAAIGSVPTNPQDENAKLQQAVDILVTVDSQLGTHLLQLAKVAQTDPKKYNNLISMLNLL
jgi:hypothetical protein